MYVNTAASDDGKEGLIPSAAFSRMGRELVLPLKQRFLLPWYDLGAAPTERKMTEDENGNGEEDEKAKGEEDEKAHGEEHEYPSECGCRSRLTVRCGH